MEKKNETKSVFATLSAINVNEHIEEKDIGRTKLKYLSWAWAWAEIKKAYPDASYTVYENAAGINYHNDGNTCWVKTGVTINGLEHIEYLPVMDNRNASIPLSKVTSMDVNKAIQRSLTKACARHGLGLYIYAGEDLPEDEQDTKPAKAETPKKAAPKAEPQPAAPAPAANDAALKEAYELLLPEIQTAPSREYLNALHARNAPLHDYKPYKDAMNKRAKDLAAKKVS